MKGRGKAHRKGQRRKTVQVNNIWETARGQGTRGDADQRRTTLPGFSQGGLAETEGQILANLPVLM